MKKFITWIEFHCLLYFFALLEKFTPIDIDLSSKSGLFAKIQSVGLLLLHNSQYWPLESLHSFTERRLQMVLSKHSNHFSDLHESLKLADVFRYIRSHPITSREDLRKKFFQTIESHDAQKGRLFLGTSTGTTGKPLLIAATQEQEIIYRLQRRRLFDMVGVNSQDEFLFPRCNSHPHYCKKNLYIKHDLQELINSYTELVDHINKNFIHALYAFPSFLVLLADKLARSKAQPPDLKAIFSVGENLSAAMRSDLEKALSTKLYDLYASTELGSIAQECPEQSGLHINPEFHYIEIISENNLSLPADTWGRLIITPLDAPHFPLVRYDTGDIAMLLSAPCPCGRSLPRIKIRGRKLEMLPTKNGALVSPYAFKEILDYHDPHTKKIIQHQLIINSHNKITFLLVPSALFKKEDLEAIKRTCEQYFNTKADVDVEVSKSLRKISLKTPYIVRET